jgi:5'-3' exonuclease
MLYDAILVDVFNVCYRKYKNDGIFNGAKQVIDYLSNDIIPLLSKNGKLYLLYDPIPKSDLGVNKTYKTARQEIVNSYKSTRLGNPEVLGIVKFLRKYYTFRGDNIVTVIAKSLEADDFVEGLIELEKDGNIAMISNDKDWTRYLSENVVLIDRGPLEPYTCSKFFEEYKHKPSTASVILRKSLYGDYSDNITGVLKMDKVHFYEYIEIIAENAILDVAKDEMTLDELENIINDATFPRLNKKEDKTQLETLLYHIITADVKKADDPLWVLKNNIRVIKCRCKDVTKFLQTYPENNKVNMLYEKMLGEKTQTKKFKFGNVSIN